MVDTGLINLIPVSIDRLDRVDHMVATTLWPVGLNLVTAPLSFPTTRSKRSQRTLTGTPDIDRPQKPTLLPAPVVGFRYGRLKSSVTALFVSGSYLLERL